MSKMSWSVVPTVFCLKAVHFFLLSPLLWEKGAVSHCLSSLGIVSIIKKSHQHELHIVHRNQHLLGSIHHGYVPAFTCCTFCEVYWLYLQKVITLCFSRAPKTFTVDITLYNLELTLACIKKMLLLGHVTLSK